MTNKRNAVRMNKEDFTAAFNDWRKNKQEAVSDLIKAASNLWALGVPAILLAPVINDVYRELSQKGLVSSILSKGITQYKTTK